jgi:glucose/arabinose dehydrogenase
MAFAPDGSGRLFCLELKTGDVRIVVNDTVDPEPWAGVSVSTTGERGLLGIAFDSGFALNGYVYLYYTAAGTPPVNRVVRITESAGRGDTSSLLTLYEAPVATPCGTFGNHNAGALAADAEGTLFISTGENNCPALSQSLSDPRGKILRIDPSLPAGANAVPSNAFHDDGDPLTGNDDRIYALGLRNPYGMALGPAGLYVTENGPDCNDEVDRIHNGMNGGWRPECNTGPSHCECGQDSPYTPPLWAITPTIAPTGLVVCNGTVYPELEGKLLFLSYNDGRIRAGTFAGDTLGVAVMADPGLGALFDIVRGPDGFLYVSTSTSVFRIEQPQTGASAGPGRADGVRLAVVRGPAGSGSSAEITLAAGAEVSLRIYDVLGRLLSEPLGGYLGPGIHSLPLDTRAYSSGVYFARLAAGTAVALDKFTITQ